MTGKKEGNAFVWLIYLDTSGMQNGLCPAVWFDRNTSEITEYAESFDEVADK